MEVIALQQKTSPTRHGSHSITTGDPVTHLRG
jgi:hypothetical protein